MPRPSQIDEQRRRLLPVVARAFGELGYRRATTAELARRCKVRENILYRLWKNKKSMFVASIDYVYENSERIWTRRLASARGGARSEIVRALLDYEASHLGEFGHHRILFAGLNETDDLDIRRALLEMYRKFQSFIRETIEEGDAPGARRGGKLPGDLVAWTLIGLGTLSTIGRELGLLSPRLRRRILGEVGRHLLDGEPPSDPQR